MPTVCKESPLPTSHLPHGYFATQPWSAGDQEHSLSSPFASIHFEKGVLGIHCPRLWGSGLERAAGLRRQRGIGVVFPLRGQLVTDAGVRPERGESQTRLRFQAPTRGRCESDRLQSQFAVQRWL